MNDKTLVIVSKPNLDNPDNDKHYVLRSNDADEVTLLGNIGISGSIVGIGNTYQEARTIYRNLAN